MKTTVVVVVCYVLGALIIVPWCLWEVYSDFNWTNAGLGLFIILAWLCGYFPVVGGIVGFLKIRRLLKTADQALSEPGETTSSWQELLIERLVDEIPVPGFIAEPIVRRLVVYAKRRVQASRMGP